MSEINPININNLEIIPINSYIYTPIHQLPVAPPVSLQIGSPVIDIPGCIKFNPANKKSLKLIEEDERGTKTLCDGSIPYFFPLDYQPENLIYVDDPVVPTVKPQSELETDAPKLDNIPNSEIPCPAPNQPRVGTLTRNGNEKVIGHELSLDKKTCIVLYEDTTRIEKLLPTTSQVSTTAAIAVVATAAAASTPVLLRLIKPLIKQLIKRIKALLGKKEKERFKGLKRKKKLISESHVDD